MRHPVPFVGITCLIAVCLAGCTTIRPTKSVTPPGPTPTFSHAAFQSVLQNFVDGRGRADYATLRNRRTDLDTYLALLARYSPDSDPQLFPTRDDELASWVNAFNAAVIAAVLQH